MTYIELLTVAFADLLPEDRWLTDLPCFADDGCTLDFPSPVTFLVGENGSGKSTILEALAACAGSAGRQTMAGQLFSARGDLLQRRDLHRTAR